MAYCAELVTRPTETVFLLITDLYEGGDGDNLVRRLAALHRAGVRVVVLLALSGRGRAGVRRRRAARAAAGHPGLRVHPDAFPDLLGVVIGRGDPARWLAEQTAVRVAVDGRPTRGPSTLTSPNRSRRNRPPPYQNR